MKSKANTHSLVVRGKLKFRGMHKKECILQSMKFSKVRFCLGQCVFVVFETNAQDDVT